MKINYASSKKYFLLLVAFIFCFRLSAQTVHENIGWFAWFNSYRLSSQWSLHFDGQVRSADDWKYIRNIILRPGVTYIFNPKNSVTVGYAYISSHNRLPAPAKNSLIENRIWEQYIYAAKFGQVTLQNRFRLEQRFIERQTEHVFAQRLRYFVRTIIPLEKQKNSFSKGIYAAVQNEIFLNVQNKSEINNHFFDQNRIFVAVGYRFSPKVDLEGGYMNQFIKGRTNNISNNIIQMALYTRF
jgi:hypothetical protein